MPKKQYNLENIRTLLTEGFTAEELRRLCYDEADFKPVYDQLAQNTGKAAIIDLLLEYAARKLKMEALLGWAKAHNPAMYAEHQPYEAAFAVEPPRPAFGRRASRLGVMVGAVSIILLALALSLYYLIPGAANHQPPPEREAASSIQPTSTPPPPPTLTPAPTPTLSPLPDGFNIGVAEFARLDETVSEEVSQQVSQWLYETVERSLEKDFDSYIALHIRGPADMGPVKGNDKVSRAEHAAILAQRHNLTILIYGVMGHGQGGLYFEPNFFVPYDQKDFDYVRELGGSTRFGAPIYLGQPSSEGPLSSLDFETKGFVNRALLNRAQALSDVLLGLSDFFGKRFVEAIKDFERALVASDKDGQEVIDMLLGTAYLRTTDAYLPGTAEWQAGILNAQQAFSQALTINSDYARAHLGMGTAWLNRAKSFTDTGQITSVDADLLQKAVDEYDKALKATDRPPLAHVPEKAHYQLGQTYQLGYEKKLDSEKVVT
ncbi:MAG: hypothetical protein HC875_37595 [Anaerolineales bacterium]|nr:hypothetical protein [Anaerolineales bacterium]